MQALLITIKHSKKYYIENFWKTLNYSQKMQRLYKQVYSIISENDYIILKIQIDKTQKTNVRLLYKILILS